MELRPHDTDDKRLATVPDTVDRMDVLVEETPQIARQDEVVSDPELISLIAVSKKSLEMVATEDQTTIEQGEDVVVLADPERLKTPFENLLRNAVEHNRHP